MKFHEKRVNGIGGQKYWTGKKNNIFYKISRSNNGGFYITISHSKKDITLNTLWLPDNHSNKTFSTLEKAKEFCENFIFVKYKKYCLGSDANKL